MLTKPDLADDTIVATMYEAYGLHISDVAFLPIGADVDSIVYRITADDGTPYFLKLRRGDFDEVAVAVPAYLHAAGIRGVMAPIMTSTNTLSVRAHGFDWMLYPFLVGTDVWNIPLSAAQWIALGKTMKAIHTTVLPPRLATRVPQEDYAPRCRDVVRHYSQEVAQHTYDDSIAGQFATFWRGRQVEIERIVQRAEQLGQRLQQQANPFVVCHTDVHAGNVMVGPNDELTIVDWDNPLLAPKERDLMFVGGGIGNYWKDDADVATFYQGYGVTEIDWVALCYYRYERIVADIAAYTEQIFGVKGSVEEREESLGQITGQFEPNEVIDIAHRTYEKLA